MIPILPPKMLDFALVLALNDWEDEEKLTVFQLELLDRKLKALSGIINGKNLLSTEEAFQKFYTMETDFCKELGEAFERWSEMAGQNRGKQLEMGKLTISRPRGGSSGARDMELEFLQEEEAKETEEPRMQMRNALRLDAGFAVDAAWTCGHLEQDNGRFGAGERQEKTMDRGGVG